MGKTFKEAFKDAQEYIPTMQQILGIVFMDVSTAKEDKEEATDIVFRLEGGKRMACRVRDVEYLDPIWDWDFTIRLKTSVNGDNTEYKKIMEGVKTESGVLTGPDFMLYCIASEKGIDILKWMILDITVFKAGVNAGVKPRNTITDRPEHFHVFNAMDFIAKGFSIIHRASVYPEGDKRKPIILPQKRGLAFIEDCLTDKYFANGIITKGRRRPSRKMAEKVVAKIKDKFKADIEAAEKEHLEDIFGKKENEQQN